MSLEKSDKIVFLGDFFDHGEREYSDQKQNFLNVMDFKKQNQDKVVVLIGNHDANYILPDEQRIRMHGTDKIIFLDSEAEMRNVYAEIDTDVGNVEVKKLNNVWDYW